jgi:YegS/Rv2252/BmrU family lipid kinase
MAKLLAQRIDSGGDGSLLGHVGEYTWGITPYQQPVLIYNPTAGKLRRDPERILQTTTESLARAKLVSPGSIRSNATSAPGDATRIAREAVAAGADLILVLGGDGTVNEAVNGMVHSSVALGILPGGTANVLAMELGLGSRLDRAIERLSKCAPRRVSVGRLRGSHHGAGNGSFGPGSAAAGSLNGSRHFLAMGGAGLDASIVRALNPEFKARAGKLAYWVSGFAHITERVSEFEARINGNSYRCGFALASRVRNYGGDLEIASGASLAHDDFEFVLFEGSNPLRYLWYMLGVSVKRVKGMTGVHTVRGDLLELPGAAHLQVDGEYAGESPARIDIVPGALTLLMPPDYR